MHISNKRKGRGEQKKELMKLDNPEHVTYTFGLQLPPLVLDQTGVLKLGPCVS